MLKKYRRESAAADSLQLDKNRKSGGLPAYGAWSRHKKSCACSLRHLAQRYAQRVGYTFAIGRVCLQAVADMADLELLWRIAHGPGGVCNKKPSAVGAHQAEKLARLGVIILIVLRWFQ